MQELHAINNDVLTESMEKTKLGDAKAKTVGKG